MNRAELKEKAKKIIDGNKWYIWKPLLIVMVVSFGLTLLGSGLDNYFGLTTEKVYEFGSTTFTVKEGGIYSGIASLLLSLFTIPYTMGYAKYVLSLVRGQKQEIGDIFTFMKEHFVLSILVSILVSLNVTIGTILLIIPGIIAALGLMFYAEVCADNPELRTTEVLRKAWSITKGFKADLFVLGLSFIGWALLMPFTLGLLAIWLVPYITVTFKLAYEELRTNNSNN